MTAAALLARLRRADRKLAYDQLRTWIVAQSVRNALQTFHGRWGFDPDNPGSGEGFISDRQMRALHITVRRAVHEALAQVDKARNVAAQPDGRELYPAEQEALDFCEFQLQTIRDYMEPPGSPELEEAYKLYVSEPDVNPISPVRAGDAAPTVAAGTAGVVSNPQAPQPSAWTAGTTPAPRSAWADR